MIDQSLFFLLEQHPVIVAQPFCRRAASGQGPHTAKRVARLRGALRELLGELTTMQRATNGGNYDGLARFLLRADMNAAGLLGLPPAAAYAWLTSRWREPQPPPDVVHAWKTGLAQLIGWVRHHGRPTATVASPAPRPLLHQAV